jgi:CDGSH-type Zn-finger protein
MEDNKTVFSIIQDGPVHVNGSFQIRGSDGAILKVIDEVYLCRCGGSKNKPFCDDTHKKNGFHD